MKINKINTYTEVSAIMFAKAKMDERLVEDAGSNECSAKKAGGKKFF